MHAYRKLFINLCTLIFVGNSQLRNMLETFGSGSERLTKLCCYLKNCAVLLDLLLHDVQTT